MNQQDVLTMIDALLDAHAEAKRHPSDEAKNTAFLQAHGKVFHAMSSPPALETTPPRLSIQFRPLLFRGSFSDSPNGPVILVDSEQSREQQRITLWHEVLHLITDALGVERDENWIETIARRFAVACPDVLPPATSESGEKHDG